MREIYRRLVRSSGSSLTVLGVLLSAAIVVLFLTDLETRYRDTIAAAKTNALNFATILAAHAASTFEDVDRVLLEAAAIRRSGLSGKFTDPAIVDAALRGLQQSSSILVDLAWTDASGAVIAHSDDHTPPRDNVSDMSFFVAQRDSADDRLFIAPPYLSATGDRWLTAASRRLTDADGSFAGIVAAPLDQSYFIKIYRAIDLGKGGSVALLHREGQMLARQPQKSGAVGKSFADGPLFTKYLPGSETGAYEMMSPVDGVARVAGYKVVPGLPLVVIVTFARSEVLASWYSHLLTFGPLVAAMVVAILLGTLMLVRQSDALAAKTRALARTNARFDIAIGNMSQGLCLFDADKRLVISNSRFQQMYGLSDALVRPGTPLDRILQSYVDRGETGDLTVDHHTRLNKQDYELADGRKILVQRRPLPDGGWVATHEDVTEQKRSEQLLVEKAAELQGINLRFDAALSYMSQGLCMFDVEQKVVFSNARYGEIYHLSRDQIKPGTSLRQILEYRREKGTHFDIAVDTYVTENVKMESEVRELADGRVVAIARHLLSDGGWLTTHEDITDRARSEKRIAFLAQHDLLTGLANRALFSERLDDAVRRLQRHGATFTVLMLDLDRFKNVNDTLGHQAGDQLLIEVARRLRSSLRDTDFLARLGGDEFVIIQENEKSQSEGAIGLALRIIGLVGRPFDLDSRRIGVGTSIGIAFAPEHGADAETLLKKADLALYATKSGGRNDFRIFQPELIEAADNQMSTDADSWRSLAS